MKIFPKLTDLFVFSAMSDMISSLPIRARVQIMEFFSCDCATEMTANTKYYSTHAEPVFLCANHYNSNTTVDYERG